MNTSDWLRSKIEALQPPAPPRAPYMPTAVGQPPPRPAVPLYPGQQLSPAVPSVAQQPQQLPTSHDPNRVVTTDDLSSPEGVAQLIAEAAARAANDQHQTSTCPNCHKDTLYQGVQLDERGIPFRDGRQYIKCSSCNYPHVQSGSTGGALSIANADGPARAARQLRGHAVEVMVGGRPARFEPQQRGSQYV